MLRLLLGMGGTAGSPQDLPPWQAPPFHLSSGHACPYWAVVFPIFNVSLHGLLHNPAKLIFFKHHFAHVTTLLKTNLWGLFCT